MISLVTDQEEATRAFRRWADAMTAAAELKSYGWVVEGKGLVFSNYGWGAPGEIRNEIMLGVDRERGSGTVKIVQPEVSKGAKGKLTLVGRDDGGRLFLLREGRLTKNSISRLIKDDDFTALSGLIEVPVFSSGVVSDRHWFVVADLDDTPRAIVSQTVSFALACIRARSQAGGGEPRESATPYGYGMDETGGVTIVTKSGGTAEVVKMQGYVYEQLKKALGPELKKPKRNGFSVDGMIEAANLLIEIKTSLSAHSMYEAVGQLLLYPSLIGLPQTVTRMLLVPDEPEMRPNMAAALDGAGIEVFTYSINLKRMKPKIKFPKELLERYNALSKARAT